MRSPCGLTQKDKILINAKKSCQSSVDLRGQYLSVLPRCVHQKPLLNTIQYLELSYNDFTEIPQEVCVLVNLQELHIQHNKIKSIPSALCNVVKLRRLGLAHNQIQTVPLCFYKLFKLEWLNLSGNQISVVPPALLYLIKLSSLFVLCNPIENVPRDVYIQGIKAIRGYFNIEITETEMDGGIYGNTSNNDHVVSQTQPDPVIGQHGDDEKVHQEEFPSKNVFHERHLQLVSEVEQSQKAELQLISDLKERLRLSQEIRKMNIDYLKKQQFRRRSHPRSRRISDLSLDSGIRDHCSYPMPDTSEYGSLSSFAVPHHDDDDDDDTNASVISSESQVCDCSESTDDDLSDVELPLPSRRHITHGDICVIIPECNLSGHFQSEFYLEVIQDFSYEPPVKAREVVASEILMMEPHGAVFYKCDPAIISLPYDVKVSCKDQIVCWCSNTGIGDKPRWKAMDKSSYTVYDNHVEIRAQHFSLFAVVAGKQYPSAQRLIKKGVGGCLFIDEVPGVEVDFPETSLLYDIEATIRVLYSDDPYDVDHSDPMAYALAAPVVELGPHGCQFDLSSHDLVTVRLPLPNGKEIMDMFGHDRQLTFWCSSTLEDETLNWQQFTPTSVHIDSDDESLCSVYFSVEHFTFFRVLWDVLDAILYEAKLGASHYIPVFQFYVSCQALMSESEDGVRFGLCVSCSRFGKPLEGIGNFPIPIGNHPPKMIHTGPVLISVISGLFEADTAAGQESLTHTENFTGRQIVVQFICKFTGEPPAYGSFGKVEIHQPVSEEVLFSFNLDKPRDAIHFNNSHAWDVHLSRELAALVTISTERDMGDEVWEEIAHALRYTQAEITKIAASADPMTELLANYKRRGGQPHEFITAMYSIGQYRSSRHNSKPTASTVISIEGESPSTSDPKMCPCTKKAMRKRKLPQEISLEDKFFEVTGKVLGKWKELGRILKMNENKLREIEHNYKQDGVREQAYQMLLAWRDNSDPQNCTLSSLSVALCKMGMGYVARQSCMVEMG